MAKYSLFIVLAVLGIFASKVILAMPSDKVGEDSEYDEDYVGDSDQLDDEEEEEEEYSGPPPVIHTQPQTFKVRPGATAILPCNVSNSDPNAVLMWKKGSTLLFSDSIKMAFDDRFARQEDNSLEIRNVNSKDSGEYTCELSTQNHMHIIHTLHVYAPPKIVKVHPGPHKVVLKGNPVTLKCEVEGYPEPTVTWTKKGKRLPSGEDSKVAVSITFESVERNHNGTYECTAENEFGKPAKAMIDVHVQYAPEIKIEKETVNTAEGYESELSCIVHAEPKAKVYWYKEGHILEPTERIVESKRGSHHTLSIKNTQNSDFGTYTCFANNSIGRHMQVVKLSGVPSKAKFNRESPKVHNGNGQSLSWTVESNSPITEYKLLYRKRNTTDWKVSHPEVINPEGNMYTVNAELNDIGEGVYEAALLSKNAYGWSIQSDWQSFTGMDYQKTEPQANTVVKEEAVIDPSSGMEGLRPTVLVVLFAVSLTYFHV